MDRVKYPRTPHLPWSKGTTRDDLQLLNTDHFVGQEVVVTLKLDGENTTLYRDGLHARSLSRSHHPSRSMVSALWARIAADIPQGWRICGENMQGYHSIRYAAPDPFYVFSMWDEHNVCFSWDATALWCACLELPTVPVLYRGVYDEKAIRALDNFSQYVLGTDEHEGYVVRLASSFPFSAFGSSVAKWVRENHVNGNEHWSSRRDENRIGGVTQL